MLNSVHTEFNYSAGIEDDADLLMLRFQIDF